MCEELLWFQALTFGRSFWNHFYSWALAMKGAPEEMVETSFQPQTMLNKEMIPCSKIDVWNGDNKAPLPNYEGPNTDGNTYKK